MKKSKYQRFVQTSVTIFLNCNDEYLFIKRHPGQWINANEFNGIGGRLENGENYMEAAVRETKEETGYEISPETMNFCGILKLQGGYEDDWVVGLFKAVVETKVIPLGDKTPEGDKFFWIKKEDVLTKKFKFVDDINYLFDDITDSSCIIFGTAKLDEKMKIKSISKTKKYY